MRLERAFRAHTVSGRKEAPRAVGRPHLPAAVRRCFRLVSDPTIVLPGPLLGLARETCGRSGSWSKLPQRRAMHAERRSEARAMGPYTRTESAKPHNAELALELGNADRAALALSTYCRALVSCRSGAPRRAWVGGSAARQRSLSLPDRGARTVDARGAVGLDAEGRSSASW